MLQHTIITMCGCLSPLTLEDVAYKCRPEDAHVHTVRHWVKRFRESSLRENRCLNQDPNVRRDSDVVARVVLCTEDKNAIWNYKFTALNGKRQKIAPSKPFGNNGRGKLTFGLSSQQGFDHGIKSGHCIRLLDPDIKSIDGVTYQDGKFVNSEPVFVTLSFRNGTRLKVSDFRHGALNGLILTYHPDIDPETNDVRVEKKLTEIELVINGEKKPEHYRISENFVVFSRGGSDIVFSQDQVMVGKVDFENGLVNAAKPAKLFGTEPSLFNTCFEEPLVAKVGSHKGLTYDLQAQKWTDSLAARLIRYLDKAADASVPLTKLFDPKKFHPSSEAQKIIEIISIQNESITAKVLYDKGMVVTFRRQEGSKVQGHMRLAALTDVTMGETQNQTDDKWLQRKLTYDEIPHIISDPDLVKWVEGSFDGVRLRDGSFCSIMFTDGSKMEGFTDSGAFHGLVRVFDPTLMTGQLPHRYKSFSLEGVHLRNMQRKNAFGFASGDQITEVKSITMYRDGRPTGPSWHFLIGGNLLCRPKGDNREAVFATGSLDTVYRGGFGENLTLENGYLADIRGESVVDQVPVLETTDLKPVTQSADETESRWITVTDEGVFAKVDIPALTTFAYYGGVVENFEEWNRKNEAAAAEHWRPIYKNVEGVYIPTFYPHVYDPNPLSKFTQIVYVPSDFNATSGHKIKHAFDEPNCAFVTAHHPKFGVIPAAKTAVKVSANQELQCHYNLPYFLGKTWYKEGWRTHIDRDWRYEPIGKREGRREVGVAIPPMMDDENLYREFYAHATHVLHLDGLS